MTRTQPSKPLRKGAQASAGSLPNRLRIIGGRWRGRPITFPALPAVRPSPDRVRETLFNWLQHDVPNARCLDLFAGSGALGIEALSRGAARVVFVDREPQIANHLRITLQHLGIAAPEVFSTGANEFLHGKAEPFDIVFLDPPFASNALATVCDQLSRSGWLADPACVYVECPADMALSFLPAGWSLHRSKRAGQVGYHLLRITSQR